ncbi:MAG: succinate dehydrogenase cytochrome b subunit [Deltaproteobacteria bacterium]|nr:succinate dehydrogenase cytochrome b subunit [Deltaproteobacteria bacterium]
MKQLMAVTGLGLALFLLAHLLGNLQVFAGRDVFNSYAETLQSLGPLLWVARGALLVIVLVHIAAGLQLVSLNRGARPVKYKVFKPVKSTWYSRYMAMSGLILLAFIVFHILHFTLGVVQPEAHQLFETPTGEIITAAADGTRHDAYGMLVAGFLNPIIAGWYLLAMALLCMHLSHGVTSFLQTLGLNHPKYNKIFKAAGPTYGWLIFLGNTAIVVAVLLEKVK